MPKKTKSPAISKPLQSANKSRSKKRFEVTHTENSLKKQHLKLKPQPFPLEPVTQNRPKLQTLQPLLPLIVFLQSLIAMSGSLYYSTFGDPITNLQSGEIFPYDAGFPPCLLCWFARILMYPLVIISYVAMIKKDKQFSDYVLPFATLGIFLELYHYSLQKFPGLITAFECSATHPCNAMEVDYFGFITIPFLALTAFVVIEVACLLNVWINRKDTIPK